MIFFTQNPVRWRIHSSHCNRKLAMHIKTTLLAAALLALSHNIQAADIPQSAQLQYRGSYGIPATMSFKRQGNTYAIVAEIKVPLYHMRFESGGNIVGNQLHATYYRDIRNGKTYAAAQISGSQITHGRANQMKTEKTSKRILDLFALSWQLAFNDGKLPDNVSITNGKKLYAVGSLKLLGRQTMTINGSSTSVNQFRAQRGDDGEILFAFAPTLGGVPAMIQYEQDDKKYDLTLKSVVINSIAN